MFTSRTPTIVGAVVVTVAAVRLVRPLWLLLTQSLPRSLHTRLGNVPDPDGDHAATAAGQRKGLRDRTAERLTGREVVILSWAGARGIVSLAAIFTVPLLTDNGQPFPDRDLLLFCTLVVVLVTLVGQGSTFAPLVRALGIRANASDEARLRNEARAASVDAALAILKEMEQQSHDDNEKQAIDSLREQCPFSGLDIRIAWICYKPRSPPKCRCRLPTRRPYESGAPRSTQSVTNRCAGVTSGCCPTRAYGSSSANSTMKRGCCRCGRP